MGTLFLFDNTNPLIDTHAHIYLEHFQDDFDEMIHSAQSAGVEKILMPNIDSSTFESMMGLAKTHSFCLPMMGLHPCSVKADYKQELKFVEENLDKGGFIAVGEMGTDLYWDRTFWEEQKAAFNAQCQMALHHKLPIVIHCRETILETIDLVRPWAAKGLSGVFHCFTGSVEQAEQITGMDFYLGLGGVTTFKNGGMDKVVPHLDRDKVVLETDAPYLTPAPHRGKRNEPAYVRMVGEKVAEFWETDLEEVDRITTANAVKLFKLT